MNRQTFRAWKCRLGVHRYRAYGPIVAGKRLMKGNCRDCGRDWMSDHFPAVTVAMMRAAQLNINRMLNDHETNARVMRDYLNSGPLVGGNYREWFPS